MGFDHIKLSGIRELENINEARFTSDHSGNYSPLDGYAVHPKLHTLVSQIRSTLPYLKLKVKPLGLRLSRAYVHDRSSVDRFALHTDDSFYALAEVGFGHFDTDKVKNGVYFESRLVTNNMFSKHSSGYYRLLSGDAKRLATKVIPFIREYSAPEIARLIKDSARYAIDGAKGNLQNNERKLFEPVTSWDNIVAEVSGLMAKGVEFTTPVFREFASKYEETMREVKAERNQPVNMYFVRILGDGETGKVIVIPVKSMHTYSPQFDEEKVYDKDNLASMPAIIEERIKVLSILEPDQYVHRIGMKVDERHYWVEM